MTVTRAGAGLAVLVAVLLGGGAARAQTGEELLAQARQAYSKRAQLAQAKAAVDLYEKAIAASAPFDALWEGARATFFLGTFPMANNSKGFRLALFEKGRGWAEKAAKQQPASAPAVFWHGTLIGTWAETKGVLKALNMSDTVRQLGEKALKLDPDVECAGPYRLLGRYYFRLPGMFGGDINRSLKLLQEGVKRCPTNDLGVLYLAETLHELGRDGEARQQLDKILKSSPDSRWAAERVFVAKTATAFLADWQ